MVLSFLSSVELEECCEYINFSKVNTVTLIFRTMYPKEMYRCCSCGKDFYDEELTKHHQRYHSDIPMENNIFEIHEVEGLVMEFNGVDGQPTIELYNEEGDFNSYKCRICDRVFYDEDLTCHHKKHHPEISLEVNIYDILELNDKDSEPTTELYDEEEEHLYKCRVCDGILNEANLTRHHANFHSEISLEMNIYEILD